MKIQWTKSGPCAGRDCGKCKGILCELLPEEPGTWLICSHTCHEKIVPAKKRTTPWTYRHDPGAFWGVYAYMPHRKLVGMPKVVYLDKAGAWTDDPDAAGRWDAQIAAELALSNIEPPKGFQEAGWFAWPKTEWRHGSLSEIEVKAR